MVASPQANSRLGGQINDAKRLHIAGDLKQAQKKYEKLLKKSPGNTQLLSLLGGLLLQQKQYKQAIPLLRRACAKSVDDPDLPYNLGLAYYHTKDFENAVAFYQDAISRDDRHDRAHYMMGQAYLEWNRSEYKGLAISAYLRDIEITDRLDSHILVGELLHEEGKVEEARSIAKRILELDPHNEMGLFILAKSLVSENYKKALVDIRHAEPVIKAGNLILKLYPNSWRGHHVIAEALAMIGESNLALEHYRKVNEMLPNFAVSRTNAGVLLLKQGRLKEGWEEISHRRYHGASLYGMDINALRRCPAKVWEGELLAGKKILIASEQGIGDQILHGQMLKDLLTAGMEVHMTCTAKITDLMARSIPSVNFYPDDLDIEQSTLDQMDYKAELLDMGKYLRSDFEQFKDKFYFLTPRQDLADHFKNKYKQFGDKLKVGISWKSVSKSVGSIKSTTLAQWRDILSVNGVQFINIQYGDVRDEIQDSRDRFGIDIYEDDFDPFFDIEKAVAQISALDLVISVSNASVHFSGQLNIPTWIILNSRPLWHWFEGGESTVWYDSVKLYRQEQLQAWEPVLAHVAHDLKERVGAVK